MKGGIAMKGKKMVKTRIMSVVMAVMMGLSMLMVQYVAGADKNVEAANYSYNVEAAMEYAEAHWNDGVGLCAEFVSKCVQAGGINIPTKAVTTDCFWAVASATGVSKQELVLASNGYAYKNDNVGKLSRGDIVMQRCYTHDVSPHILICAGFDSNGVALFYAHNRALHKEYYRLDKNYAYQHNDSCNIGAWVLHINNSEDGYNVESTIAYAEAHWNDGVGLCAEFVSKCVQAGGINISTEVVTSNCFNAIANATGVTEQYLTVTSGGYALKSQNEGKLSRGDIVMSWCAEHSRGPHIMLCGGFDSSGYATFYAHNNARHNERIPVATGTCGVCGKSGTQLQVKVLHISGGGGSTSVNNPGAPYPIPSRIIRSLYTGEDVKWVQKFLNDVMGYSLDIDGSYGPATMSAVKAFQTQYGLEVDGIVGTNTTNKMLNLWIEKQTVTFTYDYNETKVTSKVYNGHLYELYDCGIRWTEAKTKAENKGGHLVTITSSGENSAVKTLIANGNSTYYWIGASDNAVEGTFRWVTGENFSYTNYKSGQPDNYIHTEYHNIDEDYLMIYKETGEWNDLLNDQPCGYIVEYDEIPVTSIIISETYYEMEYNESHKLNVTIKPSNATVKSVVWKSSDNSVATVNDEGVVTAVSEGEAYIQVIVNSSFKKQCRIIVKSKKVDAPVITSQPKSISKVRGSTGKFSVEAYGENLKYQWYVSSDGGNTWKISSGTGNKTKTISLRATKSLNGRKYKCIISNEGGSTESAIATFVTKEVISGQPSNQVVYDGDTATFSIKLRSTVAKYQWEVSDDSGLTWEKSNALGCSTKTILFTAKAKQNGYLYRCKVTNGNWVEYSKIVTLIVKGKIIEQPDSIVVNKGNIATFRINVQGTDLQYQWQVSTNGGIKWKNSGAAGNKTDEINFKTTLKQNGYMYRCVVINGNTKIYSKAATLTVE